jgi:hypothetical protein
MPPEWDWADRLKLKIIIDADKHNRFSNEFI